jgi:hypothetical protein
MPDSFAARGGLTCGAHLFNTSGGDIIFWISFIVEIRRRRRAQRPRAGIEALNFSECSARLFPWDCVILMDN